MGGIEYAHLPLPLSISKHLYLSLTHEQLLGLVQNLGTGIDAREKSAFWHCRKYFLSVRKIAVHFSR